MTAQHILAEAHCGTAWIPAFAGMTMVGGEAVMGGGKAWLTDNAYKLLPGDPHPVIPAKAGIQEGDSSVTVGVSTVV